MAVHSDVRHVATGPDDRRAELEGLGNADRLDGDIDAEPLRQLHHARDRILGGVVDRHVGSELERLLQPRISDVDRDDASRREELRGHDRREPDRAGSDDRNRVARLHAAVQDADLVCRREDVGEEHDVLVRQALGHLVDRRVGERDPGELGLQPVDRVAEDPATAAGAEAVVAFLAEAAAPAGGDARDEHAIARLDRRDGRADLHDGADRLMPEDRARFDLRYVSLENVQVRPADRGGVDADDCVRRIDEHRIRNDLPGPLAGTVVDESVHSASFFCQLIVTRRRLRRIRAGTEWVERGFCGLRRGLRPAARPAGQARPASSNTPIRCRTRRSLSPVSRR